MVARSRGQHAGLSAASIVGTAIRIADSEGAGALSMRRIGTELGVEAMALYHHFPNKSAMLDAVVEEIATSVPVADFFASGWETGIRDFARAQLENLSQHPNLVELVMARPAVTSGNLTLLESLIEFLGAAGFSPRRSLDMIYVVNELVLMHAALGAGFGRGARSSAAESTGAKYGETGQAAHLDEVSVESFPRLAEAARGGRDRSPTARFEFALDVLVAGFAEVGE